MALKHTQAEVNLITDHDMYLTIESGIRGGIATISGRYAKANNFFLPDYDPQNRQVISFIWMPIIFMELPYPSFCLSVIFGFYRKKKFRTSNSSLYQKTRLQAISSAAI